MNQVSSQEALNLLRSVLESELREKISREYEDIIKKQQNRHDTHLQRKDKEIAKLKDQLKEREEKFTVAGENFERKIADVKKEHMEKLQEYKETVDSVESRMKKLKEMCRNLIYKGSNMENTSGGNENDLPPILHPENFFAMEEITKHLSPRSFTRLIRTNTRLYSVAKRGALKVPLRLEISTDNPEVPFFRSRYGIHDFSAMMMLSKFNWLQYRLDLIDLSPEHEHGYNSWFDERLEKLLKLAKIKFIDEVKVDYDNTDYRFFKFCKVRRLEANWIRETGFFDHPNVYEVEDIVVTFGEPRTDRDRQNRTKAMQFIQQSSAETFIFEYIECPISFVMKILDMWQEGRKSFKKMELSGVLLDGHDHIGEFLKKSNVVRSDSNLEDVTREGVMGSVDELKPMLLAGTGDTFVIIREDLQMLSVSIRHDYNEYCNVILKTLC